MTTGIITSMAGRSTIMLDDFFTRALLAGVGLALTAGPLGCFIIWRRMSYYGDTMAHSALLGVALGFMFEVNLTLGVFIVATLTSLALLALQKRGSLSTDALLGILSHSALALGLVVIAFMTWIRVDLMAFLFGDILAVSRLDIALIWGGGALVLATIALCWRPLLAATVNEELAQAEGMAPDRYRLVFMLLMALVIAIAMKVTPEQMAVLASLLGAVAVVGGLFGSLEFDTPSGPSIVVAALVLFLLSLLPLASARTNGSRQS
jgi:zinc transport system permease protein